MATPVAEAALPTRTDRRRERTRAAILDAAEETFRASGFDASRIEQIAELADVSVGSIYVHFDGKQGLYLACVDRALELMSGYMARTNDPSFTPLQRVLAGGDAYLRFHLDHPGAFQLLAFPGRPGKPDDGGSEVEARIRDRHGAMLEAFAATIDAAIEAGEAHPVDSRRLTWYLWGAWNGVIGLGAQPDGLRLDDEEIAATLELGRSMLREALAAPNLRGDDGWVGERVPLPNTE